MFARQARSDASDGRRRESRGLGPFSGGQLTAVVITFAVLLLFPLGAWAVSFSNVAITDPGGVNQAKVDAKNNLNTAVHDAVSGVAAKVNAQGQQLAAIAGPVTVDGTTRPANPVDSFTTEAVVSVSANCKVITPPAAHALVVTSVTETEVQSAATFPEAYQLTRAVGSCAHFTSSDVKATTAFTSVGTVTVPFSSGLVIPSGTVLAVRILFGGGAQMHVAVNGYQIPSSFCPSVAACSLGT